MARKTEQSPEFFVDRSLGKSIVKGLRAAGMTVLSMADVYGEERAQLLPDEVWLRDAGEKGWSSSLRTTPSAVGQPSATR
jgi:PIN like domain